MKREKHLFLQKICRNSSLTLYWKQKESYVQSNVLMTPPTSLLPFPLCELELTCNSHSQLQLQKLAGNSKENCTCRKTKQSVQNWAVYNPTGLKEPAKRVWEGRCSDLLLGARAAPAQPPKGLPEKLLLHPALSCAQHHQPGLHSPAEQPRTAMGFGRGSEMFTWPVCAKAANPAQPTVKHNTQRLSLTNGTRQNEEPVLHPCTGVYWRAVLLQPQKGISLSEAKILLKNVFWCENQKILL